jgi:SseB protein N-terminal domain
VRPANTPPVGHYSEAVPGPNLTGHRYAGDDGSADPAAAAALAAYAAGTGDERAALAALAAARLLVPVVAMPGEGASEMALPTVIGNDGRPALLAFTCLDSLRSWRADARPVPVPAAGVWQAGVQEADAVVIDIAGPVPFAVEGARLAALAEGRRAW